MRTYPLKQRVDAVADESDLEEIYQTERHLLTLRVRERGISCSSPASRLDRSF